MNVNKYWMRLLWYAEKSRSGRPRPWLFRISQEPNPIIVFVIQCFEENNDKNTEPCLNGCVPNAPAILDKIKWNSKPHPSQGKDEGARRAKTRHFSILDLGGRGGSRFSIYFVQDCGSRDSVIALGNHALGWQPVLSVGCADFKNLLKALILWEDGYWVQCTIKTNFWTPAKLLPL